MTVFDSRLPPPSYPYDCPHSGPTVAALVNRPSAQRERGYAVIRGGRTRPGRRTEALVRGCLPPRPGGQQRSSAPSSRVLFSATRREGGRTQMGEWHLGVWLTLRWPRVGLEAGHITVRLNSPAHFASRTTAGEFLASCNAASPLNKPTPSPGTKAITGATPSAKPQAKSPAPATAPSTRYRRFFLAA